MYAKSVEFLKTAGIIHISNSWEFRRATFGFKRKFQKVVISWTPRLDLYLSMYAKFFAILEMGLFNLLLVLSLVEPKNASDQTIGEKESQE